MPDVRKITPTFGVAGQVSPDELAALAAQGFRTIINNRPDGEEPGQPSSAALQAQAAKLGLSYLYLPVTPGLASDDQARTLATTLDTLPGPVLGFCRSGRRTATLWALAQVGRDNVDSILAATRFAGYDLEALRPRLQSFRGAD